MSTSTHKRFVITVLALTGLRIYLFVTVPPPLATHRQEAAETIVVENALAILNAENTVVRQLYTKDISLRTRPRNR